MSDICSKLLPTKVFVNFVAFLLVKCDPVRAVHKLCRLSREGVSPKDDLRQRGGGGGLREKIRLLFEFGRFSNYAANLQFFRDGTFEVDLR